MRRLSGIFCTRSLEISHCLFNRFDLIRPQSERRSAVKFNLTTIANRKNGSTYILYGASKPLAIWIHNAMLTQHFVYVPVGERRTIAAHRGFFKNNSIRQGSWTLRRILLRYTPRDVERRVPHLEESLELGIRVPVRIDRR